MEGTEITMKNKLLTHEEISLFCMELSLLLRAGIGVSEGLHLLADDSGDDLPRQMGLQVDQGCSLADAIREAGCFPEYVCGLVEVGEQTGRLEEALQALSAYYDSRHQLSRRIRSALVYPAILFVMMLAVVVILLTLVLPVFNDVYASLGGRLTGVAGGLFAAGQILRRFMPLLAVLLAALLLLGALFAFHPVFRERAAALWHRRRGDRGLSRQLASARFAQALAMGVRSGLNTEDALRLSARLEPDCPAAQNRYQQCMTCLENGGNLAEALEKGQVLPQSFCRMLSLAQRSGSTDTVMEEIARRMSLSSEAALEQKVSRVEPVLVITASLLVGAILLSVMLPLMNIMSAIG